MRLDGRSLAQAQRYSLNWTHAKRLTHRRKEEGVVGGGGCRDDSGWGIEMSGNG